MKRQDGKPRLFSFTLRDFLIFAAIFICALVLCTLLRRSDISDGFASSGYSFSRCCSPRASRTDICSARLPHS